MAEKFMDLVNKEYLADADKNIYKHITKTSQHNLLKITAQSGTQNGISYTVDKKAGTVFIPEGQTASDTVIISNYIVLPNDSYILSGCPEGGNENTYYLTVQTDKYASNTWYPDHGSGVEFTGEINNTCAVVIVSGYTIPTGGLLFKPMIRYAEDTDETFTPYAENNLELTQKVSDIYESDFGAGVNLFDYNEWVGCPVGNDGGVARGSAVYQNNGVTLTATANDCYTEYDSTGFPQGARINVTPGQEITMTWETQSGDGDGRVYIFANGTGTGIGSAKASDGKLSIVVPSSTTFLTFRVGVDTAGDTIHYKNIMFRRAKVLSDTYYPHIKTNQQLQEDVEVLPENAGKNKFNENSSDIALAGDTSYSVDPSTHTITVTGKWYVVYKLYNLKKNTDYIISIKAVSGSYRRARVYDSTISAPIVTVAMESVGQFYETTFNTGSNEYINVLLYSGVNNEGTSVYQNIMIRPAGTSPDFVPYMRSNLELTHDTDGVRGVGRNEFNFNKSYQSIAPYSVVEGITFDFRNSDYAILNGTCTSSTSGTCLRDLIITTDSKVISNLRNKIVTLECNVSGVELQIIYGTSSGSSNSITTGSSHNPMKLSDLPSDTSWLYLRIVVMSGTVCSNTIAKIMIRDAKYADDPTYYPYSEDEIEFQERTRGVTVGVNAGLGNAATHNALYRGKDITSYFTDGTLFTRISSGTFEDLYIGDYFTVSMPAMGTRRAASAMTFILAAFDYYYNCGDTALTTHHAVIIPDGWLYSHAWNNTQTTDGGYYGSRIHTILNDDSDGTKSSYQSIFGSHLITWRDLLTNAVNADADSAAYPGQKGMASNWDWYTTTLRLMNEIMVCGSTVWSSGAVNIGCACKQLPYFKYSIGTTNKRDSHFLLSDIVSTGIVSNIEKKGYVGSCAAHDTRGVRPIALID